MTRFLELPELLQEEQMAQIDDPREKVFPNWFDLSDKYEGYETKGIVPLNLQL